MHGQAHLTLFGARTSLSASALRPGTVRTGTSAVQSEAKPALEEREMSRAWRGARDGFRAVEIRVRSGGVFGHGAGRNVRAPS
jgi:hypothetical protein